MIRITNIKLPLTYHDGMLTDTAAKALGIEKSAIACVSLFKRSVDARRKSNVHFTAALDVVTKRTNAAFWHAVKTSMPTSCSRIPIRCPQKATLPFAR